MKLNKLALAAVGAISLAMAGSASADTYPDFTVTPGAYGSGQAAFSADRIAGTYREVITFNLDGTFDVSILWQAGNFYSNDGNNQILALTSGMGVDYTLYALFQGTGVYATNGLGVTSFTPTSGSFNVYLDNMPSVAQITTFTAPALGGGGYTTDGVTGSDDVLLATGAALNGAGSISCTSNNSCGSFDVRTSFALTATDGSAFFSAPTPFYNISIQSGDLNGFTPSGTVTINGEMDIIFGTVPEPTSLALVGLSLLGVGLARRQSRKA